MRLIKPEKIQVEKNVPIVEKVTCDMCGAEMDIHSYTAKQGGSCAGLEGATMTMTVNMTGHNAIFDVCEKCTLKFLKLTSNVSKENQGLKDYLEDYKDHLEDDKADMIQAFKNNIKAMEQAEKGE